mmetsp:Transcript_14865/g.44610  ORF Transcript_14865/g.44610 Transcript_14865/m.44610 type:complete len:323 (+) Transcript_14865:2-970(+)
MKLRIQSRRIPSWLAAARGAGPAVGHVLAPLLAPSDRLLDLPAEAIHIQQHLLRVGLYLVPDGALDAGLHLALPVVGAQALLAGEQLLQRRGVDVGVVRGLRALLGGEVLAVQVDEVGEPGLHADAVVLVLRAGVLLKPQDVDRHRQLLLIQLLDLVLREVEELQVLQVKQILYDLEVVVLQGQELEIRQRLQVLDPLYPVGLQVEHLEVIEHVEVRDLGDVQPLEVDSPQALHPLQGGLRVHGVVLGELRLGQRVLHHEPQVDHLGPRQGHEDLLRLRLRGCGRLREVLRDGLHPREPGLSGRVAPLRRGGGGADPRASYT